ncbi:hypothetical protein ABTZ44_17000 [Microbacterium oxydans]|uniref:hypothetical protein n=1 Tax=Microbacterium TaxID=33882 RepID=UPI00187D61AF|nr:hypothetical protein [Microbacterium sp. R1]MBE7956297.1 hypothetical protein [Microbacterium sp. R1]
MARILATQRERSPHGALITEWLSLSGLRWSELRALRVGDLATSATGLQLRGTYFRRAVAWTTTSPEHTIHDLRHFAASTWLRQGIPINQVAAWLGDDPRTV